MTTQQLADFLRIHPKQVIYWSRDNGIAHTMQNTLTGHRGGVTRQKYFDPKDITSFLEKKNPGQIITISEKYL